MSNNMMNNILNKIMNILNIYIIYRNKDNQNNNKWRLYTKVKNKNKMMEMILE